jgi:transposase
MNRRSILYKSRYFASRSIILLSFEKMKSKDLKKLVLSKYQNGDRPTKIFRNLNGALSVPTIEQWCKSIRDTGCINLLRPLGRPRTIRAKAAIRKVKHRLERRKPVSSRKLAYELGISRTSVRRILKNDLKLHAYKIQNEPMLPGWLNTVIVYGPYTAVYDANTAFLRSYTVKYGSYTCRILLETRPVFYDRIFTVPYTVCLRLKYDGRI